MAKDLDWPVVTLIHSMDDYGIAGADRIEHYAKVYGICIYRRFAINLRMDKSGIVRSEEHTSELSHQIISYAVFCLKKKTIQDDYLIRF